MTGQATFVVQAPEYFDGTGDTLVAGVFTDGAVAQTEADRNTDGQVTSTILRTEFDLEAGIGAATAFAKIAGEAGDPTALAHLKFFITATLASDEEKQQMAVAAQEAFALAYR